MQDRLYSEDLNEVVDYILANLDKPLTLEYMCKFVNMSPYNFHKFFTNGVGESVPKFVLRKRLELSAIALLEDETRLASDIAYEMGFATIFSFCRSFKKHFGIASEEYRMQYGQSNSKNCQSESIINQRNRTYFHYFCEHKSLKIGNKKIDCNFKIKQVKGLNAIYCRHRGPYDQMEKAYEKLMEWAYPRELINAQSKLLSIYHNNPDITETSKLMSDACLIVDRHIKTDEGINFRIIKAGLYAIGRFEITMDEFPAAWQCVYQLLAEHGCQSSGLRYEIYHNNRDEHPEKKWIVDICIPVTVK